MGFDFNIGNRQINEGNLQPKYPQHVIISFPRKPNHIMVTWNKVSHPNEDRNIFYNIYRGNSPNGIFYKINRMPIDTNFYEDQDVNSNPNINYWYKVSSLYINNEQQTIESTLSPAIMYKANNTNHWFKKINERNMWILKNTGQLFDLYIRKYEGLKCPDCYDEVRCSAGNPNCKTCYGTGIKDGYEPMFQLYIRLKPAQESLDIDTHGLRINKNPGAWTISTIQIKNRDIIIDPQGIIYSVTSSHINQAAGYLFHQELQLKELERTDPIYHLKKQLLYPIY